MPTPPASPKIYHITHVANLASILAEGRILSDAAMIARGGPAAPIGMSTIKQRRLRLPVTCHPGDHVGDYVPFYFCPRSVMLYLLYRGNHPELTYKGGQGPILHLEADLNEVVAWAERERRRWAFTLSNAGAAYAPFRSSLDDLGEIDWAAVAATNWSAPEIKEGKQAEFLVHGAFPWELVRSIGVRSTTIMDQVNAALATASHRPAVAVRHNWYY